MTKKEMKQQLSEARPPLKLIAPLTYRIVQGFVGVNLLIAFLMMFISTTVKHVPNPAAEGFLSYPLWGVLFFVLACVMGYGLFKNNWRITRLAMQAGLCLKIMWAISLVILVFQGYAVFVTMILWLFLAWTQAWAIIHFTPVINWDISGER